MWLTVKASSSVLVIQFLLDLLQFSTEECLQNVLLQASFIKAGCDMCAHKLGYTY